MTLGVFPAYSISDARKWARGLNDQVDLGIDPREEMRKDGAYRAMTVEKAHALREGRASRAKTLNRPRIILGKLKIFKLDIKPGIGRLVKLAHSFLTRRTTIFSTMLRPAGT